MSEKQEIPLNALIQQHEANDSNALTRDEIASVAGLFQTVGNELHTVDHHSVGGNSSIKALKLDKDKVFNNIAPAPASPPAQARIQVPVVPVVPQSPTSHTIQIPENDINVSKLEQRVIRLEQQFTKIIKPPHKKNINVKFKSEHITAVFDDFEDIVDAVRKSLNKSSKRITIILNEN